MVAARSASPAPDARIASELGSLVLLPAQIGHPRWRLDAVVRLVPALHRFAVSLDRVRAHVREAATAAICPAPLRAQLVDLLVASLDRGPGAALANVVEALWTPSWVAASTRAVAAVLTLGNHDAAQVLALQHLASERYTKPRVDELLRRGCLAERFVGDLRQRGSEERFEPSPLLLGALVDAICKYGDAARVADAERLASRVDRRFAIAQLARLALRFAGIAAARAMIRGIRERSLRSSAMLALVRDAIAMRELDVARELAAGVETQLASLHARLALARGLFERERFADALRVLYTLRDPRVEADRRLLIYEIRLVVRHGREDALASTASTLHDARRVPGWLDPDDRFDVVWAVVFLRAGLRLRDQTLIDVSARTLRRIDRDRAHRVAFLALAERAGIDVDAALVDLQTADTRRKLDAIAADRVALRAERLASSASGVPLAMACGLAGDSAFGIADARSIERAMFDEGIALSTTAAERRRVLIGAARYCLRSALARPAEWKPDVIDTRLRTLLHVGGTLGRDAIAVALRSLPIARHATSRAIDTLCELDARVAASIVLARGRKLRAAGVDIERSLRRIELRDGVPRGFAAAFSRARAAIDKQGSADADDWLTGFVAAWRARSGELPGTPVLDAIAARATIPVEPIDLLRELVSVRDLLRAHDHIGLAERIASDLDVLPRLLLGEPARVDDRLPLWSLGRWRALFARAARKPGAAVDPVVVRRFARILGRSQHADALYAGELARLGVSELAELAIDGDAYRVRLLDKRLDVLTYLRFADVPVWSCYRSASSFYDGTQGWTIVAWKDPLTFCFHIERKRRDAFRPCGFLFGGFADIDGRPAVVLNSLHVKPRRAELREAIVRAVECMLCEPLAIDRIGIANDHGGYGPLPANYVARSVMLTRHRALRFDGAPVTRTFDDISPTVNERIAVDTLYWRT